MLINSGTFSKNGNFSGYNIKGERIHFFKRQMDALGIKTNSDVKSFYAVVATKTYGAREAVDAAGNKILNEDGTPKLLPYADGKYTMTRATATAVFKTEEEYINALASFATLDAKVQAAVKKEYSNAGIKDVAGLEALAG